MSMYERSTLCRVCEGPVADGGVLVAELDLEKLGRWWLQVFETEFDDDLDALCSGLICQFCLWDARYKCEKEKGTDTRIDWWADHAVNQIFKNYYFKGAAIRSCEVSISAITQNSSAQSFGNSDPYSSIHFVTRLGKTAKCDYCDLELKSKNAVDWHVSKYHRDVKRFKCSYCKVGVFSSSAERKKHTEKFHSAHFKCNLCSKSYVRKIDLKMHKTYFHGASTTDRNQTLKSYTDDIKSNFKKCAYCSVSVRMDRMSRHLRVWHKNKANIIRCTYPKCQTYFVTFEEQQKHIQEFHAVNVDPKSLRCIYCQRYFSKANFTTHVHQMHFAQAIRCTVLKCVQFFHSNEERDLHIAKDHKV